MNYRLYMLTATMFCMIGGVLYIELTAPVYRATALVEQSEDGVAETSPSIDGSRWANLDAITLATSSVVLSKVVREQRLEIVAKPVYWPVIGAAWARAYQGDKIASAFLGLDRFAWGGEQIDITVLELPRSLTGQPLTLIAGDNENYTLLFQGRHLISGRVGERAESDGITVEVARLRANADTQFSVLRMSWLDSLQQLKDRLDVRRDQRSGGLRFSLDGGDPDKIAVTLAQIIDHFVQFSRQSVAGSATGKSLTIVEPVRLLASPVSPSRYRVLAFCLLTGPLLGLVFAVIRSTLRPHVRTPADLAPLAKYPLIAVIAHDADTAMPSEVPNHGLSAAIAPAVVMADTNAATAFRSLATAIELMLLDASARTVVIGATHPGSGVGFVTLNLAVTMASAQNRVIMIDADIANPKLHNYLRLQRGTGLGEILRAPDIVDDAVHRDVAPHVDLMTAGCLTAGDEQVLCKAAVGRLVNALTAQYRTVLIAAMSTAVASDTVAIQIARSCAVHLQIVRSGLQSKADLKEKLAALDQCAATVDGLVLNDWPKVAQATGGVAYYRWR